MASRVIQSKLESLQNKVDEFMYYGEQSQVRLYKTQANLINEEGHQSQVGTNNYGRGSHTCLYNIYLL